VLIPGETFELALTFNNTDGNLAYDLYVRLNDNAVLAPIGGSITLSADVSGDEMVFKVADTGSGIAPEDLPRVFKRFYRVDPARYAESGESGLGLAIAKSIVETHGGTIAVESELGEGTTFTIRLPRKPA
jgi:signal transduction histidine kinase